MRQTMFLLLFAGWMFYGYSANVKTSPGKAFKATDVSVFHANDYVIKSGSLLPASRIDEQVPTSKSAAKPAAKAANAGSSQKGTVISLKVVQNVLQFDKKLFTVKAGQKVTINFENPDFMQHNLVILKPGSKEKVGAAADQMAADPKGAEQSYIPKVPEVLFSTKLLNPQEKTSLQFTAPSQAGDYPFICTFPGHWRIMNGIMKVAK